VIELTNRHLTPVNTDK